MLSHIVTDLYESYIGEVLTPQIGKQSNTSQSANKPESKEGGETGPGASSAKRIRQAVYDIRYRARREDVPLNTAFSQYMSHTSMNSLEKKAVREKLGLVSGGGASSIKEELKGHREKKYKVRVSDKQSKKIYVRGATRKKIQQLRSNPYISSVEMTKYGKEYEGEKTKGKLTAKVSSGKGLDPVGREDSDVNNDGKVNKTDKYLKHRRDVRGAAIDQKKSHGLSVKKKKVVKEEYSDWRKDFDIFEASVDDDIESSNLKQIKEKNIKNKVKINPDLKETFKNLGGDLIEAVELTEEFIGETVNHAAEYFFEQGLNEDGVDILIEELGKEKFCDWVFEISEERAAKKRTSGKSYAEIKAEIDAKEKVKAKLKDAKKAKTIETAKKEQKPTAEKTSPQKTKKGILDRVAGAVMSGVERHQKATAAASQAIKAGVERHRQATKTASHLAKETGKTAARVGKVASHVGSHAASTVGKAAKDAKKVITKEETDIQEVAPPGAKFERMVKHIKAGYSKDGLTPKEKSIAYATTWKSYNKKKVDEAISTVTGTPDSKMDTIQKNTEMKQTKNAQQKLNNIIKAKQTVASAEKKALGSGVNVNV